MRDLWVEDDAYLNCALAVAHGEVPYHDFVLQHTPLLEELVAAGLAITGPSIRSVEIATQVVVVWMLMLIAVVGWRLGGPRTAAGAVVLAAWSPVLWRYRLFHRELVLVVPVLAAVALLAGVRRGRGRTLAIGALLALAVLVKFTAVAYAFAVVAALALERTWGSRAAASAALSLALIAGGTVSLLAAVLGWPFVAQVLLFGIQVPSLGDMAAKLAIVTHDLVPLLLAAVAGSVGVVVTDSWRRWRPVLLAGWLGALFVLILKPVAWGHNVLELLPWAALLAAAGVERLAVSLPDRWRSSSAAAVVVAVVALSLGWFAAGPPPRGPRRWIAESEISRLALATRRAAAHDEPVFVPSLVAFVADRRELVINFEIAAWSREVEEATRHERGPSALRRVLQGMRARDYVEVVDGSLAATADAAVTAIRSRRLAVVATPRDLWRSPLFPFGVDPQLLQSSGYRPLTSSNHYLLWSRVAVPGLETRPQSP